MRIINTRSHPIKVLGREWLVKHEDGTPESRVALSPGNAIVGELIS